MSNQPFSYPPPPPPPPRREAPPTTGYGHDQTNNTNQSRGRGGNSGFGAGRDQNRGRGGFARGRGASYTGSTHRGNVTGGGHHGMNGQGGGFQHSNGYVVSPGMQGNNSATNGQGSAYTPNHAMTRGAFHPYGNVNIGSQQSLSQGSYSLPPNYGQTVDSSHSSPVSRPFNAGQKRPHSAAFSNHAQPIPRPKAAPAVPSFNSGIPFSLPQKPPPSETDTTRKEKTRKHNQLGLTPASQDPESGSDDDEEEEKKFAAAATSSTNQLEFEYRGHTSTLKTAADIAAWIAERKKKYPTMAKTEVAKKEAAEKKLKWEESKKARSDAARAKTENEKNEREKQQLRRKLEEDMKIKAEQKKAKAVHSLEAEKGEQRILDAATKARLKAEKLKKKAQKQEAKAAAAEEAAKKATMRRTSSQSVSSNHIGSVSEIESNAEPKLSKLVPEVSQDMDANLNLEENHGGSGTAEAIPEVRKPPGLEENSQTEDIPIPIPLLSPTASDLSSNLSDSDLTSSSGSGSYSESDSESDSDSDSAPPEQKTLKRLSPDRVPLHTSSNHPAPNGPSFSDNNPNSIPNANVRRPKICRKLVETGKCHFGSRCRFSHDLSQAHTTNTTKGNTNSNNTNTNIAGSGGRNSKSQPQQQQQRKTLWQAMVDKELEEERKLALNAIIFMGENGLLGGQGGRKGMRKKGETRGRKEWWIDR